MSTAWEEYQRRLAAQGGQRPTPTQDGMGHLEGMAKSALWSLGPGLFGAAPSENIASWQAENPGKAFVAEVAGLMVPYAGAAKVGTKLMQGTKAWKAADASRRSGEAPIRAAFKQEVMRFAPFEGARLGVGAFFGDTIAEMTGGEYLGTGTLGMRAGADLALAGVVGGAVEGVVRAGKRLRAEPTAGETSLQRQLNQAKLELAEGTGDPILIRRQIEALDRQIRRQEPPKGERYIGKLEGATRKAQELNRLFTLNAGRAFSKKMFIHSDSPTALNTREEVAKALAEFGLEGKMEFVQTPRMLSAKTDAGEHIIRRNIKKNMDLVDAERNLWMVKDQGDGLFVMAQRGEKDWAVWKTSNPELFAPGRAEILAQVEGTTARFMDHVPPMKKIGLPETEVYDSLASFKAAIPEDAFGAPTSSKAASFVKEKLKLDKVADSELASRMGRTLKDTFAPRVFQFSDNPLARKIYAAGRHAKDTADRVAEQLFLGGSITSASKSILGNVARGGKVAEGKGIAQGLDAVHGEGKAAWEGFVRALYGQMSPEDAAQIPGITDKGIELLRMLKATDEFQTKGIIETQRALGIKEFVPMEHHYMMSRAWKGDHRVPLYEDTRLVGYASGRDAKAAQTDADRLMALAKEEGKVWRKGRGMEADSAEEAVDMLKRLNETDAREFGRMRARMALSKSAPTRLEETRAGARGFVGDFGEIPNPDFIKEQIFKQLTDYQRYNAKISFQAGFQQDLNRLASYSPEVAEALRKRIDDTFGIQGSFSAHVNKAVDKVLAPVMGKNSASKISGTINKVLGTLQFGFWNTGFLMANILTPFQSTFPQLIYLSKAADASIARYYTHWPVLGQKSVDSVGMLDVMRVVGDGFKQMGKPDPALWKMYQKALAEGVTDPKFVEEYVGQNASKLRNFRGILSGDQPLSNYIAEWANILPAASERFARGHAFATGYSFFKNVLKVEDDELVYQLTKEFVQNTQFMYSAADRANVITGPLGSSVGLFKNWIMHYMGWLSVYAGEGVMRNNWAPLLWAGGGTAAIGGVGALGPATAIAEGFSQWAGDKTLLQQSHAMFTPGNEQFADALYYGLPAFLGFSLQSQVSILGMDPAEESMRMMTPVLFDRVRYLGMAVGSGYDFAKATGRNPIDDPLVADQLMRALGPKAIHRTQQAWKDETLRSVATGRPVADLTPGERILHGAALNPIWAEKQFTIQRDLWRDQDKRKAAVSSFGEEFAWAMQQGDTRLARDVIMRAGYQGVDLSKVVQSAKTQYQMLHQTGVERTIDTEALLGYLQSGVPLSR